MKDGISLIKSRLKTASASAGVYRMLNEQGDVLYVGKAKNLKKRLTSYTQEGRMANRIRKMVFETADLILVETETEAEALLLEISLIKSLKPKYNVMFRDDTSYPYILITAGDYPRITHHRGVKRIKGSYFGPYPDARAMYQTIDMMERSFLIRTCKDSEFENRTRPCLKYHIKRCSAPCVGKVDKQAYKVLIDDAVGFLNGKGKQIQSRLKESMLKASEDMRFEDAAVERDRLKAISAIIDKRSTTFASSVESADVLGVVVEGGKACVQLFSYRSGQHVGNAQFFPKGVDELEESEVLRLFVAMHYGDKMPPKLILTSHAVENVETVQQALSQNYKVEIHTPERGEKKDLILQAVKNAKESLKRKQSESQSWTKQMKEFAHVLEIEKDVKRIETFDISNISGKQAVASMVVAGEEGMLKSDYRKYSIKSKDSPDDYAMMREVLMRRYGGLLKQSDEALETGEPAPIWPDVIMVDGGKGHLSTLVSVMEELGLVGEQGPVLCAIAKGEYRDKGLETIYKFGFDEPLDVPFNSPLKFMLQIIRDESHRFAIGFHRAKRNKATLKSGLDDIPGIGPKRKKELLLTFGSLAGVKGASVKELQKVDGISKELAEVICGYFKG